MPFSPAERGLERLRGHFARRCFWKQNCGARQLGKPCLVGNFLAPRFESFVKIDFEKRRDLRAIFEENAAGSLLEFAPGEISVPVGRLNYLRVGPMNFREYLPALGKEPMAAAPLETKGRIAAPPLAGGPGEPSCQSPQGLRF